jgi:diguanylate cyclase (GGDEF)-like protein
VSFLLVDVGHFKRVNDTKGHAAGDLVLHQVARCLISVVRNSDAVGRWGGEEFIVALPGMDLEGARQCAERVRHAVERLPPDSGPVTVSAGLSALERGAEVAAAIARANARRYPTKSNGRNRVE